MSNLKLYEIYVPCVRNNGKPIRTKCHKVWDKKVTDITGGLTITAPVMGKWINPDGKIFNERVIPVKIACTEDQIKKIAEFTIKFYEQEAVLYSKVSDEVVILHKNKELVKK